MIAFTPGFCHFRHSSLALTPGSSRLLCSNPFSNDIAQVSTMAGQHHHQLTQFEQGVINEHAAAAADGSNFTCHWNTLNLPCNCISYAISVRNRTMTPSSLDELTAQYNAHKYFEVPLTGTLARHDVEVYARGQVPLHAHKIVNTSHGGRAESKMGNGPVVDHPRQMLESSFRNRQGQFKYGRIVMRFRLDEKKYEKWFQKTFKKTGSGRIISKDKRSGGSGSKPQEKQQRRTRSGRPINTPGRYKETKKGGGFFGFLGKLFGSKKH
ncbi:hypothetical protein QBC37DRAFT_429882 [Rhypophila decipiens]|uniref:DUF7689 domain-containing protein n=1 Tax=Rhypophila decipiens TaxID=261697 RepID=A0AAN6XZD2_9PEZI|nr:hypothetical protein QBC37DRAFT_429882 [Rhypophila decipiens]